MLSFNKQTININRETLLTKLRENLQIHIAELKEAREDYKQVANKFAHELVERVSAGDYSKMNFEIQPPKNYTKQYTDVIELLEYSEDAIIPLGADLFRAYVKNEWDWINGFRNYATSLKGAL